jgi:hypothetical protein
MHWVMPLAGVSAAFAFLALFALPAKADDSDPTVRVKIAMTLLQVLGLIKDYALQWHPPFLLKALSTFDVLNVGTDVTAPACGQHPISFYHSFIILMFVPVAVLALCAAVWAAASAVVRSGAFRAPRTRSLTAFGRVLLRPRGALGDAELGDMEVALRTRCKKNAAWLVMLLYPGLCKKIMQLYGTRPLEGGDAYLRAAYDTQSRATAVTLPLYSAFAAAGAVLSFVYPLGIPLFFCAAIRAEQRAISAAAAAATPAAPPASALKGDVLYGQSGLDCDGDDGGDCYDGKSPPPRTQEEERAQQSAAFLESYVGFLVAGYRPGMEYWELLEMLRKMGMAAIAVFAVDGAFNSGTQPDVRGALSPMLQPFLGQVLTVLYLTLFLWVRPFVRSAHNSAQSLCLMLTWGTLLAADSLFNVGSSTGAIGSARQDAIGAVLAAALLLGVLSAVAWALAGYLRMLRRALEELFPAVAALGKTLSKLSSRLRVTAERSLSGLSSQALLRSMSRSYSFASSASRSRRYSSDASAAVAAVSLVEETEAEEEAEEEVAQRRAAYAADGGLDRAPRVADGDEVRSPV